MLFSLSCKHLDTTAFSSKVVYRCRCRAKLSTTENLPVASISKAKAGLEAPHISPLTNPTRILRLKGKISLLASGMSPKNFSVYQRPKTQTKLTLELAILQSIAALVDVGIM